MAKSKKVAVELDAQTGQFSANIQKSAQEVKSFADRASADLRAFQASAGKSFGVDIAKLMPSGKGLQEIAFKDAAGFAGTLKDAAQGAAELSTNLRTGKTDWKQLADEGLSNIPIVGQFKQAGEAIRELITGEKAATEEARKLGEAAERTAMAYRDIALHAQTRGIYGGEKERQEIENAKNSRITAIQAERAELAKKASAIEERGHTGYDAIAGSENGTENLSKAQQQELTILLNDIKLKDQAIKEARKDSAQAIEDQKRDIAQSEIEFDRSMTDRIESSKAALDEKVLRRQGRPMESAIRAAEEMKRANTSALMAGIDPNKLEGMTPEQAAHHVDATYQAIAQTAADAESAIEDIKEEYARREAQRLADRAAETKQIQRQASIAQLEAQGNQLAAQKAMIEDEWQSKVDGLKKQYDEDHKSKAATEADEQQFTDAAAGLAQQRQAKLDAINRTEAERIKDLHEANAVEMLRIQGQTHEAEVQAIKEQWEKKLAIAKDATERQELLKGEAMALAVNQGEYDRQSYDAASRRAGAVTRRFDTGAPTIGQKDQTKEKVLYYLGEFWRMLNNQDKGTVVTFP